MAPRRREPMVALKDRIREIRKLKKLPQKCLISYGVKQSYIANLEAGNIATPSPEMITRIAAGLGLTVHELVRGTEFETSLQQERVSNRAFCPNNLCPKLQLNRYASGMYLPYRFGIDTIQAAGAETYEMKFCPYCGDKLLSVCPNPKCQKPIILHDPVQTHCVHCGGRIFKKLTEKQVMAAERKVKN
jgi:transcriptional regulator with XRE-family HTH domain